MKEFDRADDYNDEGILHYDRGEYEEAILYYNRALELDPNFVHPYYNLGLVYKNMGDPDKALFFYEKAHKIDPTHVSAINGMGTIYYNKKEYDTARNYYEKALKQDKNFHFAYYNLGLIEHAEGNNEKAFEYMEQAVKIKPNYEPALNDLGNYYYDLQDYDKAKEYYEKAVKINPSYKFALYNLGLIAEVNVEYKKAKRYYERTLKLDPNYESARKALEFVNERLEETDELFDDIGLDDLEDDFHKEERPEDNKLAFLNKIGRNLREEAESGRLNDVIGRERELETMLEILHKRFKNNPIILGYPGVGKTAIVEGLAKRIAAGEVPPIFKDKIIIELNTGMLIAGTKYRGEMEAKVKRIIEDAAASPDIILFIDEIHTLIGAGQVEGGNNDMAQMLKPALARGDITCIGATTLEEYKKYVEKDPAFERRFYPVIVEEMSPEGTREILYKTMDKANSYYKVKFTKTNVDQIVDLTNKHIKKRYFPDKAIDIFEKIASRKSIRGEKSISSKDIRDVIGEAAGINFLEDEPGEFDALLKLEDRLKETVFGQDEAIKTVCNIIRITKRRLDLRPERPDGVFLFTGPTGVGKTYLAKMLARFLFGTEKRLIKLDMSEFSEPHSVSKLIGSPPGYVGYGDSSSLTDEIENNPTSILVLDEIEKAHPEVIKLFLQVFDEGKLTDSKGKKIYFSDVTIIMTSNILTRINKGVGFSSGDEGGESRRRHTERIIDSLGESFPKEFINRIDEVVLFNPLNRANIRDILLKSVLKVTKERFAGEKIKLKFSDSLIDMIVVEGYNPELGARNLQRTFEKVVLSPLVSYIYENRAVNCRLEVDYRDGEVCFKQL